MAALIYSPLHDLTVIIEGTGFSDTLVIQNTNAQVLQARDVSVCIEPSRQCSNISTRLVFSII